MNTRINELESKAGRHESRQTSFEKLAKQYEADSSPAKAAMYSNKAEIEGLKSQICYLEIDSIERMTNAGYEI